MVEGDQQARLVLLQGVDDQVLKIRVLVLCNLNGDALVCGAITDTVEVPLCDLNKRRTRLSKKLKDLAHLALTGIRCKVDPRNFVTRFYDLNNRVAPRHQFVSGTHLHRAGGHRLGSRCLTLSLAFLGYLLLVGGMPRAVLSLRGGTAAFEGAPMLSTRPHLGWLVLLCYGSTPRLITLSHSRLLSISSCSDLPLHALRAIFDLDPGRGQSVAQLIGPCPVLLFTGEGALRKYFVNHDVEGTLKRIATSRAPLRRARVNAEDVKH